MKLSALAGCFIILILYFSATGSLYAQSPAEDSLLYHRAVHHLVSLYLQSLGDQSGLYNGSQYAGNPVLKDGHAFFYNEKPGDGSIEYDQVPYEHVRLQYDEVQDIVIMEDSARHIQLINERIAHFSLFENDFIRLVKDDSLGSELVKTGFYNQLYAGKTSVYKKEIKTIREDILPDRIQRSIDFHYYYYIKKEGRYHALTSKKHLLNLFGNRKKDIQQYIRKNKLSYRRNRDNMLIQTATYYDQLTP